MDIKNWKNWKIQVIHQNVPSKSKKNNSSHYIIPYESIRIAYESV